MKRIITALVLIPIVLYAVLWAPQWLFLAVLTIIALVCFHEFGGVIEGHGIPRPGPAGYAAGLILLLAPRNQIPTVTLLALAALCLVLFESDMARCLPRASAFLLGVVYIFGAWSCAVPLRAASPHWLFFVLALTWVGDTAAYYVGRAVGRHKMAPRLSPAKSWEGAAASLAASLTFGVIYVGAFLPEVSFAHRVVLAVAANAAGQIGDLSESAMKRGARIKDSSALLPGHGGWLDRVDSALFALPVTYLLLNLLS